MTSTSAPPVSATGAPDPDTAERVGRWIAPKFWRSWAWLAALLGGFVPVVLPDVLNWVLENSDAVVSFAFPTLSPFWKLIVLKAVVVLVLALRPLKQPNMATPAPAPAAVSDSYADTVPASLSGGLTAGDLLRMGEALSPQTRRRLEEAAAQQIFNRHAADFDPARRGADAARQ